MKLLLALALTLGAVLPGIGQAGQVCENGFGSINGLSSINGLNSVNGLNSYNGLNSANGLAGVNGLSSINGLPSTKELTGTQPLAAAGAPSPDGHAVSKNFANWLEYPFGIPESEKTLPKITQAWRIRDPKVAATEQGRQLLKYFARCTLPEGQALVAEVAGQTHVFPGRVGLAPKWISRPLDQSEQRWVSACLLAHVNAHGVHVPIDIRGPHARLSTPTEEDKKFPIEEGAFFGNLFAAPEKSFSCMGSRGEKDALSQFLKLRSCTEVSETEPAKSVCGFGVCGSCATAASCTRGPGYFEKCRDPRTGREYAEVVTVYLMR